MWKLYLARMFLVVSLFGFPHLGFAASFYRIDDGSSNSYLTCVSADGRFYGGIGMELLAGQRFNMHLFAGAVSSLRTGVTNAPTQDVARYSLGSEFHAGGVWAMNSNGTYVVGETNSSLGNHVEGFRWSSPGGILGLGDLSGGPFESYARGISGDGSVVVGFGTTGAGTEAFRWTSQAGLQQLGFLPAATSSAATAISADGATIAGQSGNEIFLWKQSTGMTAIGVRGTPAAMTPDGKTLIGVMISQRVFRWTELEGVLDLGRLPNQVDARVYGISGDGDTIVGQAVQLEADQSVSAATIWDPVRGMRDLKTVLTQEYGINLSGLQLIAANGISLDGTIIVGEAHTICPGGPSCKEQSFGFLISGMRPFQRPSVSIVSRDASVELSYPTQAGYSYTLQTNAVLGSSSWGAASTRAGTGATQTWTNGVGAGQRFFRVTVQ